MTERCFPAVFIGVFVRLGDAPRFDSSYGAQPRGESHRGHFARASVL